MLALLLISCTIGGLAWTGALTTLKNAAVDRCRRVSNLQKVVRREKKGRGFLFRCRVVYCTLMILAKALWIGFIQATNNSVREVSKLPHHGSFALGPRRGKPYEVSYVLAGRMYSMLVHAVRGPRSVLRVVSEDGEDVTDTVLPALSGPSPQAYTPGFFNFEELRVEMSDGRHFVLGRNDPFDLRGAGEPTSLYTDPVT